MRGYLRNEENLWWKLSSIEKEVEKTTYVQEEEEEKMKKSLWKRAGKTLKKMERTKRTENLCINWKGTRI